MNSLSIPWFLTNLLVILFSAKLFGEWAERWGQPAVLGELLGGVILGAGLVSFFHPQDPVLSLMAEFGVILLLFQTGLESDLEQLLKVGPVSIAVAALGMIAPFLLGYAVMSFLGHTPMACTLVAAALTASSVGITARVLSDLGKLGSNEAQIILGAAVLDDILGIIILSVVQQMAATGQFSGTQAAWTACLAVLFVLAALLLGPRLSNYLVGVVGRMRAKGSLVVGAVCFAFAMALIAHALGSALVVGAFAAGTLLAQTDRRTQIHQSLVPIADIFVPIFFVMVGANVDLHPYAPWGKGSGALIGLSALLILVAVLGKFVSGWAAWPKGLNRVAIGVGMIPRGEVGLIFAQVGLASHLLDVPLYTALIATVLVSTFITPLALKRTFR